MGRRARNTPATSHPRELDWDAMYSKTNPGGIAVPARRRRALAAAGTLVLLAFGGAGIWAAVAPDALSGSAHGCVNVRIPNSMGGATLHYCGAQARSVCHDAVTSASQVAGYERPACRDAGLGP